MRRTSTPSAYFERAIPSNQAVADIRLKLHGPRGSACFSNMCSSYRPSVDTCSHAVKGVALRPLACWDCGFESHRGHVCLSLVSVVYFQVEVFSTGWSLVQRSPTEYVVSNWVWSCDYEASITRRPWTVAPC